MGVRKIGKLLGKVPNPELLTRVALNVFAAIMLGIIRLNVFFLQIDSQNRLLLGNKMQTAKVLAMQSLLQMLTKRLFASDVVSGGMFLQNAEQILNCSKAKEKAKEKAKAKAKISLGVVERGGAKVPRLRPRLGAPRVGLPPNDCVGRLRLWGPRVDNNLGSRNEAPWETARGVGTSNPRQEISPRPPKIEPSYNIFGELPDL